MKLFQTLFAIPSGNHNLPCEEPMLDRVARHCTFSPLGFRSRAESIADAIQRRLEQILELEAISARRK